MRKALRLIGVPLLSLLLVGVMWQGIVVGFAVPSFEAPRPLQAVSYITSNWGVLWPQVEGTLRETVYGQIWGVIIGFLLAVIMAKVNFLHKLVLPILIASQAVPIIALASPLVLIMGFTDRPIIFIVALIVFFPVTINVLSGLLHVDRDLLNLAKVCGASRWRTFWTIELPASTSSLFAGLKIGVTYAVTGAIIGELVSSTGSNLALTQNKASATLNAPGVYGTTLLMMAIGICWFLLALGLEAWCTPWQRRSVARRWPWTPVQ